MSGEFSVDIKELEKFANGLKDLPDKVAKKTLKKALRDVGKIFLERAQELVPRGRTGNLKASFRIRTKSISPGEHRVSVENTAWYARLVEYGHRWVVKRGKNVIKTGSIEPDGSWRTAFEQLKEPMQLKIADIVGESVAREFKKLSKK